MNLKKNTLALVTALAVGVVATSALAAGSSSSGKGGGSSTSGSSQSVGSIGRSADDGAGTTRGRGTDAVVGHVRGVDDADGQHGVDDAPGLTTRGQGTDDAVGHVRGANDALPQ